MSAAELSSLVNGNYSGTWSKNGYFRGIVQGGTYGGALINNATFNKENWGQYSDYDHGMCNRAAASMALSYMGVDIKPYQFGDTTQGSNSVEGTLNSSDNKILRDNGIKANGDYNHNTQTRFSEYFNNYVNDGGKGKVSPVIIYTQYGSNAGTHWLVVVAEDKDNPGYYWVLDSGNGKYCEILFTIVQGSLCIKEHRYKNGISSSWTIDKRYDSTKYHLLKIMQYSRN